MLRYIGTEKWQSWDKGYNNGYFNNLKNSESVSLIGEYNIGYEEGVEDRKIMLVKRNTEKVN